MFVFCIFFDSLLFFWFCFVIYRCHCWRRYKQTWRFCSFSESSDNESDERLLNSTRSRPTDGYETNEFFVILDRPYRYCANTNLDEFVVNEHSLVYSNNIFEKYVCNIVINELEININKLLKFPAFGFVTCFKTDDPFLYKLSFPDKRHTSYCIHRTCTPSL